jgi:hypothetical protein
MTDKAPVTQEEIGAVDIAGLPALVKRMLDNGTEPDETTDATEAT